MRVISERTRSSGAARRCCTTSTTRSTRRSTSTRRTARPILRDEGYPEIVIEAVLSHAEHLAIPRETLLQKTLFACDELSGFIHACGLVRPTGLEGLEPKSVRKKLKQPSFAAGVHRDEVYAGAELLGLELDEHIANVVAALQPIARRARPPFLGQASRATGCSRSLGSVSRASGPAAASGTPLPSGTQMCAATSSSPRRRRACRPRTRRCRAPARPRTRSCPHCPQRRGSRRARTPRPSSQTSAPGAASDEVLAARRRGTPRPSRRRPARVAVADDHVPHRPVIAYRTAPQGQAPPRHAGSAASSRSRSPSDVHQPHDTRTRPARGISRTWTSGRESARRARRDPPGRGRRRASSAAPASRARRGARAARGSARPRAAARSKAHVGPHVERGEQPGERGGRPPVRLEPRRARAGARSVPSRS